DGAPQRGVAGRWVAGDGGGAAGAARLPHRGAGAGYRVGRGSHRRRSELEQRRPGTAAGGGSDRPRQGARTQPRRSRRDWRNEGASFGEGAGRVGERGFDPLASALPGTVPSASPRLSDRPASSYRPAPSL